MWLFLRCVLLPATVHEKQLVCGHKKSQMGTEKLEVCGAVALPLPNPTGACTSAGFKCQQETYLKQA